eukprot:PhM_4_TR8769/c0_g1_i1/m.36996
MAFDNNIDNEFWIRILVTLLTALIFLIMLFVVMVGRSAVRHKRLMNIQKKVRLDLDVDAADDRARIIAKSVQMVQYKMDPPVTDRTIPCYIPGVCRDVRLEVRSIHEKLRGLVTKVPALSGRAKSMSFREIVVDLQSNIATIDHALCARTIRFHEEMRFGVPRCVGEEEWREYLCGIDHIVDRTRSTLMLL